MNARRATLEIIAPTIEEAVEKGLADLGLSQEAVEIEILDEGSRGLFGLGARQARVRLTVKAEYITVKETAPVASKPVETTKPEKGVETPVESFIPPPAIQPAHLETSEEEVLRVAGEVVSELLEKMRIEAKVETRYGEADEMRSRVPVCVDVSGYRSRREAQIRQLARRMADQALKTGRRQVLEPMPANERRIVHIELRNNPNVKTESSGDEPHRKVNIIPVE